jgi:hypothetical protein
LPAKNEDSEESKLPKPGDAKVAQLQHPVHLCMSHTLAAMAAENSPNLGNPKSTCTRNLRQPPQSTPKITPKLLGPAKDHLPGGLKSPKPVNLYSKPASLQQTQ